MAFQSEFVDVALENLHHEAAVMKAEGWRFIQTHAVNTDAGIDLYYSFMKNGLARNCRVAGVTPDVSVPSITDLFLAAFVFENEARELFGVDMRDIALDFQGGLYAPAQAEPMTFITPEQKAAREKARKAQAAKKTKDAAADGAAAIQSKAATLKRGFVMTPERKARLDAKLAMMSADKVAKVKAALAAREAEAGTAASGADEAKPAESAPAPAPSEAASPPAPAPAPADAVLAEKIAALDPAKADKVRAALAARGASEKDAPAQAAPAAAEQPGLDADIAARIALMDEVKADKVRAALAARASASAKGGN